MLKNQSPLNNENRNLSEVFKELQEIRNQSQNHSKVLHTHNIQNSKKSTQNIQSSFLKNIVKLGVPNILLILTVLILGIATFSLPLRVTWVSANPIRLIS